MRIRTSRSAPDTARLALQRRAQLVQAAINVFSRVGFHEATVKAVTDNAGVSAGLAYQYVRDKHDLLFLALMHIVDTNRREIPSALANIRHPLRRLARSVEAYTQIVASNRSAVLLTYRETKSLRPADVDTIKQMELGTNALIAACIEGCVRGGYLCETHIELLVFRIITAAHAWALKNWRLRSIVTLDQYIEHSIHSCWRPLLSAKGRREYRRITRSAAAK